MKTKKQFLSLLMAVALVISMLPMTTFPAHAATESPCSGNHSGWTAISGPTDITKAGKYYLNSDYEEKDNHFNVEIICEGEVTLCLNGKALTNTANDKYVIYLQKGSLNLCDCIGAGYIDSNCYGVFMLSNTQFNMYGGTIKGCYHISNYASAVMVGNNATFNMYGGTITGNETGSNKSGAVGSYKSNKATINIYGGSITGNNKYGVYSEGGSVYISGDAKITGNTLGDVYLPSGKTITVGTLTTGADVGVTSAASGNDIAITGTNAADYSKYFHADNGNYTVINKNNVVYLHKHSYSAATCVTPKTCSCGLTEGEIDSTNHNPATEWTTADGKHYHACLNGCGTHLDEAACSGGEATCDSAPICSTCGKEHGSKLGHVYTYNQTSDYIITETCDNGCDHSATAELTVADATYTGNPITTASVNYSENWMGVKLSPFYDKNINKGTATATLMLGGTYITRKFEIKAADISGATVTLDPASGEYTGNAYTPSVTVTLDGFGTLVKDTDYTVSWDKDEFINADTYTATIQGIGNFENEKTATFIITDADITVIEVKQKDTLTYNGEEQTPDVSTSATSVNNQPITFEYSTEKGNYGAMPTFKGAGTYTVYYRATADNHIAAYGEFTVTINKQTVDVPDITSKEYNGEAQTADIESTDFYTVTENNGGTDARKYNVVLTLTDSKNYKWGTPETTENAAITLDFEITKATNEWMPEPTISGWTYGDTASTPNGAAKFGTVKVVYTGEANDGSDYNSETAPTKAGSYKATFTVTGNDNYTGLEKAVDFEIEKATYDMSGAKWDDTTTFNYDGTEKTVTITGLPDGVKVSGYTENKKTVVGNYTAKVTLSYDGNNYNTPVVADLPWSIVNTWQPTEYTVTKLNDNGWINGDFEITPQVGYKIATDNKDTSEWSDKLTYSAETDNGEVTFYLRNTDNNEISLAKTVNYKLDKTNPTGTVEFVGREPWQELVSKITFGLFFKDEVTVKITANDTLSDIANIEYYEADEEKTLDEVKAIKNWTAYNDSFGVSVEDTKKFIYFVRITDNAGNVIYLSTDGAEYDTTDPKIEGVENGATYYTTQVVTVEDKNLASVELDGETVTLNNGTLTLAGNVDATYTIKVTDKAGNVTEYTVTMKTLAELTKSLDDITVGDVTSDDKEIIEQVIGDIDEQLANGDLTEDEKAALEETKDKAQDLLDKIDEAANAYDTDNTEKVKDITADNVTPEDKSDLEKAKDDLTKTLDDYSDNLTEDEKKAIQTQIDRIDKAIAIVENVEAVEDKIGSLPENITKNDEAAIKAADVAYNALTDYEKSLVDKDAKKALDDAKAALAELNKPADTTSPNTGDNSNLWLWFALLFISGGGVIGTTLYGRKRKTEEN